MTTLMPLPLKIALIMAALVLGAAAYLFAQTAPPALDVVRFNASITDEQNKDIASALREMSVLYDAAPDNYLVNVRLGWLEYLNGAYTESVQYYRRAFDLSGQQSVEALLGLRLPLAAQNDWKSVESVYRQILQLDGGNYEANLRLGQIYLNRGDHSRAKPYLENVAQHYPADYEANLSSAWNDYSLNDYPRSRAEFQTVLMLSPGDTSATRGLQLLK